MMMLLWTMMKVKIINRINNYYKLLGNTWGQCNSMWNKFTGIALLPWVLINPCELMVMTAIPLCNRLIYIYIKKGYYQLLGKPWGQSNRMRNISTGIPLLLRVLMNPCGIMFQCDISNTILWWTQRKNNKHFDHPLKKKTHTTPMQNVDLCHH